MQQYNTLNCATCYIPAIIQETVFVMETLNDDQIAKQELQAIADKLELPVEDEAVFKEWVGQGKAVTDEGHREVFAPLYFTTSNTLHC